MFLYHFCSLRGRRRVGRLPVYFGLRCAAHLRGCVAVAAVRLRWTVRLFFTASLSRLLLPPLPGEDASPTSAIQESWCCDAHERDST